MKHAATFILVFFMASGRLFSQVSPPSLRCLEVLTNGDVKLTWIPPADPNNAFGAYEIWSSISPNNFSLVGTINGSIFTNTFTHTGAGANGQSRYYFMRSKYGPGASISSGDSDTLRSMWLNVNPVSAAIRIGYNDLHTPRLATSSGTFTILKEYPLGTWDTLVRTSDIRYPDTLSVCQASINYQVTMLDNSGCLSVSSIQRGVYNDTKNPNQPFIDSISVLPNGSIIIAWRIPRDEDIVKYRLYQILGQANVAIDTLFGRNNTSYTFVNLGVNSGTVGLTVAALDSCQNIGTFDGGPRTIFLETNYNRCDYKTELQWTPYPNMPNGLKEYRVYYSVDGAPYSQVGVTTGTTFTHPNVAPGKTIQYYVRAFNNGLTTTSGSNRPTFFSTEVRVPAFVYMKSASVTSRSSASLKLFLDTTNTSKGIDIYRSVNGVDFEPAGFVPTSKLTNYTFIDQDISPATTSYYYKAVIKDSCGNARTTSNTSKTILLKVQDDSELIFTKHLSWSVYEGFAGGVSGYNIYRVINNEEFPQPVSTTGMFASSYTDNLEGEAANGSTIDYVVEAVEGIGNPYAFMERSLSNTRSVYMEGRIFIPSAFAPNGINKLWRPVSHFIDKSEYRLLIYNRWGNKVFETTDDTLGWDGDSSQPGIYAYHISYKNARGEYQELTGTLMLYK